jgi:hypothetical protein
MNQFFGTIVRAFCYNLWVSAACHVPVIELSNMWATGPSPLRLSTVLIYLLVQMFPSSWVQTSVGAAKSRKFSLGPELEPVFEVLASAPAPGQTKVVYLIIYSSWTGSSKWPRSVFFPKNHEKSTFNLKAVETGAYQAEVGAEAEISWKSELKPKKNKFRLRNTGSNFNFSLLWKIVVDKGILDFFIPFHAKSTFFFALTYQRPVQSVGKRYLPPPPPTKRDYFSPP